jgi:8-amino-7-oxononanoate synthase
MANIGVITALCGREDEVFADRLNHASLNDGMQLCRAQFRRYPHGDLDALERMLARSKARRKLLITDAVFSMDGDIAPLPALLGVCERYDAWLLLDDAHGFGVLGEHGAGTLSHYGIRRERIVYMGTLGKAAGVFGAFVAAEDRVIDYLVNRARSYIYTTALPGMLAAALLESLAILRTQDWRRQRLRELAARLGELVPNSCGILVRSQTAIHPYIVGTAQAALRLSEHLLQYGLLVPAVRAPTVPQGSARLRISLSAAHSVEDIDRLADALREYRQ